MAEQEIATPSPDHAEEGPGIGQEVAESLRSRASSVISTGTRISILTLPQSDSASHHNIDGRLTSTQMTAPAASRLVPRPMSIYSFRSMGEALPPYSESQSSPPPPPTAAEIHGDGSAEERPQYASYHSPSNAETEDMHPGHEERMAARMEESGNGTEEEKEEEEEDDDAQDDDPPPSSPLSEHDPENAIARHYGNIVRTIDETNGRLIARMKADHVKELATIRNAIDSEYRKVLKLRNNEIERNREVAATRESELEAHIETLKGQVEEAKRESERESERLTEEKDAEIDVRCAKARHLVEDLWEERWQKRNELAAEEARRSEREWKETVRLLVDEERDKWEDAIERRYGLEELEILRRVVLEGDDGDGDDVTTAER